MIFMVSDNTDRYEPPQKNRYNPHPHPHIHHISTSKNWIDEGCFVCFCMVWTCGRKAKVTSRALQRCGLVCICMHVYFEGLDRGASFVALSLSLSHSSVPSNIAHEMRPFFVHSFKSTDPAFPEYIKFPNWNSCLIREWSSSLMSVSSMTLCK